MNTRTTTEFSALMTRAGLGLEEAADLLGVSTRTVRRYINGEGKRVVHLKLGKLREIANTRGPDRSEGFPLHRPVRGDWWTTSAV